MLARDPFIDQPQVDLVATADHHLIFFDPVHLTDVRARQDDQTGCRRLGVRRSGLLGWRHPRRVVERIGDAVARHSVSLPTGTGVSKLPSLYRSGAGGTMQVLIGTSGYSYPAWKGSFYPEKLPAAKMLGYYAEQLPRGRDQQHLLPHADAPSCCSAGPPRRRRVPLRAQEPAAHHPRASAWPTPPTPSSGFYETARGAGRQAGAGAVPAAALPEEGSAAAGGVPGPARAAAGPRRRVRVPPRILVQRRRLRGLAGAAGRPVHRRGRGPGHPPRGDRRLGLPAPAPAGLRRRRAGRLGRAAARASRGRRPTSSSSTRTRGKGPSWPPS